MKKELIAAVIALSVWSAEARAMQAATERQAQAAAQTPAAVQQKQSETITIPVGTQVALNLVSPIKSLSTKPGDPVRALVAFPVTAGEQVAIPAGTFAEGQLVQTKWPKGMKAKDTKGKSALEVHFTRLVFANGYTASMDGVNVGAVPLAQNGTQVADNLPSATPFEGPAVHGPSPADPMLEGMGQWPYPPLPPQPSLPDTHHGPNPVAMTLGILAAPIVLLTVVGLLVRHANKNIDSLLYDAGWQFQMTINQPLVLDRAQVMEAAMVMVPAQ